MHFHRRSYAPLLTRRERLIVLHEYVEQPIAVQAVRERKALRDLIDIRLALSSEVLRPLLH